MENLLPILALAGKTQRNYSLKLLKDSKYKKAN